jgi:hypothetical protein
MPSTIKNIGGSSISFGTCELGTTFGQVESASLKRVVEELGIPDCFGGFQAYLLMNPGYEFELTAIFPATSTLPVEGDPITFPGAAVIGNIITWSLAWEQKGQRKLQITAKQWDSIGSNPAVTTLAAS